MKTKKEKKAPIGNKLISELKLMVSIGATPIECVNSFAGKMSRSTVYKLYNKIKDEMDSESSRVFEEAGEVNVPSEVTEEPVSEIISEVMNQAIEEQFEEELKDGDIVEHKGERYRFVYSEQNSSECCFMCDAQATIKTTCICTNIIPSEKVKGYFVEVSEEETDDKCLECDTESAHIINELSAKNEELQKELHTSKNVIVTLQKMTAELNEAITESKCMIQEVCEERDSKTEEIRVLKLKLQHYISDLEYDMRKYTNPSSKVEELEKEEAVNHPKHYNNIAGVECIDVVEHFNFNRGNAIKYVWRAGEKSKEKEVEDLKKAIFYIEREVKNLQEVK